MKRKYSLGIYLVYHDKPNNRPTGHRIAQPTYYLRSLSNIAQRCLFNFINSKLQIKDYKVAPIPIQRFICSNNDNEVTKALYNCMKAYYSLITNCIPKFSTALHSISTLRICYLFNYKTKVLDIRNKTKKKKKSKNVANKPAINENKLEPLLLSKRLVLVDNSSVQEFEKLHAEYDTINESCRKHFKDRCIIPCSNAIQTLKSDGLDTIQNPISRYAQELANKPLLPFRESFSSNKATLFNQKKEMLHSDTNEAIDKENFNKAFINYPSINAFKNIFASDSSVEELNEQCNSMHLIFGFLALIIAVSASFAPQMGLF